MNGQIALVKQLQKLTEKSRRIVFFGGAGVSTESGIPDFRSVDGLYRSKWKYPPETILSRDFFFSHTEEFYSFYRAKMLYLDALPNEAHKKLACLEKKGVLSGVVTQNIDGLHQAAGSKKVWELHGSVHRNFCLRCKKFYPVSYILEERGLPLCDCGGLVKPDVVLYQEELDPEVLRGAAEAMANADLLIVGGTSLGVYPAAGLIHSYRGGPLVLINRSPTPYDHAASLLISAPIGEIFSQIACPSPV